MEDSPVVEEGMLVKYPSVPFATCLLYLQLLIQDSFHQEEVKQPHCRNTQKNKNHEFQGSPEAPDHLPLDTFPFLPEQCNHCGETFYNKNSLSKRQCLNELQKEYCVKIKLIALD